MNNVYAAYTIGMENTEGRYWVTTVGEVPLKEDEEFIEHWTEFVFGLVQFNELKEARLVRKAMLDNLMSGHQPNGYLRKVDLKPEYDAINSCFKKIHKKLNL